MLRRPPRSTLFPYTTSSDLASFPVEYVFETQSRRAWLVRWPVPSLTRLLLRSVFRRAATSQRDPSRPQHRRSEEHTSELQSHSDLVCRLLLEKKKLSRSTAQ